MITKETYYKLAVDGEIELQKSLIEKNECEIKYFEALTSEVKDEYLKELYSMFISTAEKEKRLAEHTLDSLLRVKENAQKAIEEAQPVPEFDKIAADLEELEKHALRCFKCKFFGKKMGDGLYYCLNELNEDNGLCTQFGYCLNSEPKE